MLGDGDPATALHAAALDAAADLVVMAGHGRRGFARLVLGSVAQDIWFALASHGHGGWSRLVDGSVAEALTQRAHVPVLLLRSQSGGTTTDRITA